MDIKIQVFKWFKLFKWTLDMITPFFQSSQLKTMRKTFYLNYLCSLIDGV